MTVNTLEENWYNTVDPCKSLILFLLKPIPNNSQKSPQKFPSNNHSYLTIEPKSPENSDSPSKSTTLSDREKLQQQILDQGTKGNSAFIWNNFMENYYTTHKQYLAKHLKKVYVIYFLL